MRGLWAMHIPSVCGCLNLCTSSGWDLAPRNASPSCETPWGQPPHSAPGTGSWLLRERCSPPTKPGCDPSCSPAAGPVRACCLVEGFRLHAAAKLTCVSQACSMSLLLLPGLSPSCRLSAPHTGYFLICHLERDASNKIVHPTSLGPQESLWSMLSPCHGERCWICLAPGSLGALLTAGCPWAPSIILPGVRGARGCSARQDQACLRCQCPASMGDPIVRGALVLLGDGADAERAVLGVDGPRCSGLVVLRSLRRCTLWCEKGTGGKHRVCRLRVHARAGRPVVCMCVYRCKQDGFVCARVCVCPGGAVRHA